MTQTDLSSLQVNDNLKIRKHGNQLMAIADFATSVPSAFFGADGSPSALPTGYKVMGYITTDGIDKSSSVSASDTQMVQSLDPVRSDIESIVRTLKVTFGEASAWTQSLYHGLAVANWPATNSNVYAIDDGAVSAFPYYRILILTQDGAGTGAVWRAEYAYRATVTDLGDLTLDRTDAETLEVTFTCYLDPAVGKSYHTESSIPIVEGS